MVLPPTTLADCPPPCFATFQPWNCQRKMRRIVVLGRLAQHHFSTYCTRGRAQKVGPPLSPAALHDMQQCPEHAAITWLLLHNCACFPKRAEEEETERAHGDSTPLQCGAPSSHPPLARSCSPFPHSLGSLISLHLSPLRLSGTCFLCMCSYTTFAAFALSPPPQAVFGILTEVRGHADFCCSAMAAKRKPSQPSLHLSSL